MANLTIKNNSYEPIALRQQQAKVGYEGAKIVDQSGVYAQAGEAFKKVNAMVIAKEESDEAERVLLASSEVTKRLSDLKINIESNMQGSNAKNAKALYEQKAQAIMDEVYAGSGIKYKTGENMFRHSAINAVVKGSHWAGQWENNQVTEARKVTYGLALDENINNVIAGSMSPEEAYEFSKIQGKHLFANLAPEQMALIDKARADKFANTLVTAAIERNDYESAQAVFDYLKKDMTSESRAKLDAAIYTNQEYAENNSAAEALHRSGITDPEGQKAFLADWFSHNGRSGAEGNFTFNPGVSWKGAAAKTESGMKSITGFLNQMGIGDIYITSVNDSDVHVEGSAHYSGNGVDFAADVLSGKTTAERNAIVNLIEQAYPGVKVINEYDYPSANSTGDHFHLDFTNYKDVTSPSKSGLSAIRFDKISSKANSLRADEERKRKAEIEAYKSNLALTINTAKSETEAVEIINKSNLSNDEKMKLIKAQREAWNPSNYMTTADADMWKYVNTGRYNNDIQLMEEYKNRSMDSFEVITPEQQRKYNKAAMNLNSYYAWADPSYKPNPYNLDYSNNQDYQQMLSDIEYMAERGATRTEISEYVKEISTEFGFDEKFIIDTIMWDKLGKVEGGVE